MARCIDRISNIIQDPALNITRSSKLTGSQRVSDKSKLTGTERASDKSKVAGVERASDKNKLAGTERASDKCTSGEDDQGAAGINTTLSVPEVKNN